MIINFMLIYKYESKYFTAFCELSLLESADGELAAKFVKLYVCPLIIAEASMTSLASEKFELFKSDIKFE